MFSHASVSAVALELQLNANMLRTWITRSSSVSPASPRSSAPRSLPAPETGFLPVQLGGASAPMTGATTERSIRVQIRKGHSRITIEWPTSAAGACAAWLRELMCTSYDLI